jgi:hypothetical protein
VTKSPSAHGASGAEYTILSIGGYREEKKLKRREEKRREENEQLSSAGIPVTCCSVP